MLKTLREIERRRAPTHKKSGNRHTRGCTTPSAEKYPKLDRRPACKPSSCPNKIRNFVLSNLDNTARTTNDSAAAETGRPPSYDKEFADRHIAGGNNCRKSTHLKTNISMGGNPNNIFLSLLLTPLSFNLCPSLHLSYIHISYLF